MSQENFWDSLVAHFTPTQHHPMPSTKTMPTVMDVLDMKHQRSLRNEQESELTSSSLNEQPIVVAVSDQYGSLTRVRHSVVSTTGTELLSMVLEVLNKNGLLKEGSVEIRFDNSGSGIRGIILSFPSGTNPESSDTSGEPTTDIVTPASPSTRTYLDTQERIFGQPQGQDR